LNKIYESFVTKFVKCPSEESSLKGQQLFCVDSGSSLSTLEHEAHESLVVESFCLDFRNQLG